MHIHDGTRSAFGHEMKSEEANCVLTILTPRHRCEKFKSVLVPILQYANPSSISVRIASDEPPSNTFPSNASLNSEGTIPCYHTNKGMLSTPALAIMLFLQERGTNSVQEVQKYFKRFPWRLHHRIELNNKRSPAIRIGQQEFYTLSREYPLWCLCPVYGGQEHLRLTLFVNKFSEMMEFYRLVTDTEMESTKPDFCLFPLRSDADGQVFLCLKRSQQLTPYPLTHAYLTFKVRNIHIFKGVLKCDMREVSENRYLVVDPDGNRVILHDVTLRGSNDGNYENLVDVPVADLSCDVTSVKSVCVSHDSGRYSDSDVCPSDLESKSKIKCVHFSDNDEQRWIYPRDTDRKGNDQVFEYGNVKVPFQNVREVERNMYFEYATRKRVQKFDVAAQLVPGDHLRPDTISGESNDVNLSTITVLDRSENDDSVRCLVVESPRNYSEIVNNWEISDNNILLSEEMYSHSYMFDSTDTAVPCTGNQYVNGQRSPFTPKNTISDESRTDFSISHAGCVDLGADSVCDDGTMRTEVDRKRMVKPVYL